MKSCKTCRQTFERKETVHCNPLAVFDLRLLGNNLVLGPDVVSAGCIASTYCGVYGNIEHRVPPFTTTSTIRAETLGMGSLIPT